MTQLKVLYVDDEPDIREVVELSLGLDQNIAARCCASGEEAIIEAQEWSPDLILCDVMMPRMDGPSTLSHLQRGELTKKIPVIFMTARAQARELNDLMLRGAMGVISKPFDPLTLAMTVRDRLRTIRVETLAGSFQERLRRDKDILSALRAAFINDPATFSRMEELRTCAHNLAGAAGIFGYQAVGEFALKLEDSIIDSSSSAGTQSNIETNLNALVASLQGVASEQFKFAAAEKCLAT